MALQQDGQSGPGVTQALVMRIEGVVEASVWPGRNGALLCRVLVSEDSDLCAKDIQNHCLKRLGRELTPQMVMVDKVKRRAA